MVQNDKEFSSIETFELYSSARYVTNHINTLITLLLDYLNILGVKDKLIFIDVDEYRFKDVYDNLSLRLDLKYLKKKDREFRFITEYVRKLALIIQDLAALEDKFDDLNFFPGLMEVQETFNILDEHPMIHQLLDHENLQDFQ